ncbi:MAG TPA: cytochrome c3 family protein [Thermodesulfovibrionales bacterium]|nr:cytochrome c3 family protein [Thermodesulfovibrionales bacterium]
MFKRRDLALLLSAVIFAAAIVLPPVSGGALASIQGSPHDVSTNQCNMCHLYMEGDGESPLWDSSHLPESYFSYESLSRDMDNNGQLNSHTLLCLGCHNGIFSNLTVNSTSGFDRPDDIPPANDVDLRNNHPVGFIYDPSRDVDNNGFPSVTLIPEKPDRRGVHGLKTGTYYPLYGPDQDRVECVTCHNPHYSSNASVTGIFHVSLLRTENTRSSMCRDCHRNKY